MKTSEKRNYIFKAKYGDKIIRHESANKRRFLYHVGTINWELCPSVDLRVTYGDGFHNDGSYNNKRDFDFSLKAFLE